MNFSCTRLCAIYRASSAPVYSDAESLKHTGLSACSQPQSTSLSVQQFLECAGLSAHSEAQSNEYQQVPRNLQTIQTEQHQSVLHKVLHSCGIWQPSTGNTSSKTLQQTSRFVDFNGTSPGIVNLHRTNLPFSFQLRPHILSVQRQFKLP